jgi:hypothetical protein
MILLLHRSLSRVEKERKWLKEMVQGTTENVERDTSKYISLLIFSPNLWAICHMDKRIAQGLFDDGISSLHGTYLVGPTTP